jgi:hypothetical protein
VEIPRNSEMSMSGLQRTEQRKALLSTFKIGRCNNENLEQSKPGILKCHHLLKKQSAVCQQSLKIPFIQGILHFYRYFSGIIVTKLKQAIWYLKEARQGIRKPHTCEPWLRC